MNLKSICGVIIGSNQPGVLANFYSQVFSVSIEEENHGDLEPHYGLDIGEVHLGIHPLSNLSMPESGPSRISIAYNVSSLDTVIAKLTELNAELVIPVHDEGFGRVATYKDPDGNYFEVVELNYNFDNS